MPSSKPQAGTHNDVNALLARLAERRPKKIDLGLERVYAALSRLGDPHKRLPPVLHVAGTNGKGSTIAFMRAMLEEAGVKTHIYSSPHLVRFNERIVVAGEEISDDMLISVLGQCDSAAGDTPLTYFEAVTSAAFLAFAQTPADILILEVGLGGRLDATNVIEDPLASIITPIGLDHQSWLGETIEEIAAEKAGIIKASRPVVIGQQHKSALGVLEDRALAVGALPHIYGQEWNSRLEHGRLVYEDEVGLSDVAPPKMFGSHQIENAGLAIAALKAAGLAPDDDKISAGLERTFWPARLQLLKSGPLVERARRIAGDGIEIWLDGGHNPHAARNIARAMADLEEREPKPLVLIAGLQAKKDLPGFFAPFEDLAACVYTIAAKGDGAANPELVAAAAQRAGLPATAQRDVMTALEEALSNAGTSSEGAPRILICGSLYLAGELLQENG